MWSVEYTKLSVKTGGSVFSVSLEMKAGEKKLPFAELSGAVHREKTARIVRFHREQKQRGQVVLLANLGGLVEIHRGEKLLYDELVVVGSVCRTVLLSTEAANAFLEYLEREYLRERLKITVRCD